MLTRTPPSAVIVAALVLAGALTGCAETQRMLNDAGRIADTAGGVASAGGVVSTTEASWNMDASELRGQMGSFAYDCPATSQPLPYGYVRGSNPYSYNSKICKAGVHAGVITHRGGRVVIRMGPGQTRYAGSTRNGVESVDGRETRHSFTVLAN